MDLIHPILRPDLYMRFAGLEENVLERRKDRWFHQFQQARIIHCAPEDPKALAHHALYSRLWRACSWRSKLTLFYMAKGHAANPHNHHLILSLLSRKLLVRKPQIRLVSPEFGAFILDAEPEQRFSEWAMNLEETSWSTARIPIFVAIFLVFFFLVIMSQESISTTAAVIGSSATLIPALLRGISSFFTGKVGG